MKKNEHFVVVFLIWNMCRSFVIHLYSTFPMMTFYFTAEFDRKIPLGVATYFKGLLTSFSEWCFFLLLLEPVYVYCAYCLQIFLNPGAITAVRGKMSGDSLIYVYVLQIQKEAGRNGEETEQCW